MKSALQHIALLVWLTLMGVLLGGSAARAQSIVIVVSDSLTSTQRTISGAKRVISRTHEAVTFQRFILTTPESESVVADSISAIGPDLILTVGSRATGFAKGHFSNTSIVFSAVLYPAISGFVESLTRPGRNITGASLNISSRTQFLYFKEIVPHLKKIGVLYTDNTASLIPPSKVLAEAEGLEMVPIKISSEKEIPKAIDSLVRSVDGIWSVADPRLFTPQATKYLLLRTIKHGIPFMGFSRHVVASGALFALDFDYKAIGRQAGKTVSKVLDGAKPGDISVTEPDVVWFHYNERTASLLGIDVPEGLAAVAKEVYR